MGDSFSFVFHPLQKVGFPVNENVKLLSLNLLDGLHPMTYGQKHKQAIEIEQFKKLSRNFNFYIVHQHFPV